MIISGIKRIKKHGLKKTVIRIARAGTFLLDNRKAYGKREFPSDKLNLAFVINGGIGDKLIALNYIACFKKMFSGVEFRTDIYFENGYGIAPALVRKEDGLCENVLNYDFLLRKIILKHYDIALAVERYPFLLTRPELSKIKGFSEELYGYILKCRKFTDEKEYLYQNRPYFDGVCNIAEEMKGRKRLQQADFDGSMGIKNEYTFRLSADETAVSEEVRKLPEKYITVHRGADVAGTKDSTKLWQLESYNVLIGKIKEKYPQACIVQMGASKDRCPDMDKIDINLVGKTSLEDVKWMLKNSILHIDGEGGFVHMRESMGGAPSAVIFGPTSMDFYSYDGNFNFRGSGCGRPCEWLTRDWTVKCLREKDVPPCTASVDPETVFSGIDSYLERNL